MPPYLQRGSVPAKRHTVHHVTPGHRGEGLFYEEVVTTAGFGRGYSIVYHLRPPTRVQSIEAAGSSAVDFITQPTLRHHHVVSGGIEQPSGAPYSRSRRFSSLRRFSRVPNFAW